MEKETRLIILAIIIILIALGTFWINQPKVNKMESIKIGFLAPLTGPVAGLGNTVKNGFELAWSEKTTVNGQPIEIIYLDDLCDPKESLSSAQKLLESDQVSIMVSGVCSSSALSIASLAQQKKFILISPVAASPKLSNSGEYVFRIASSSTLIAQEAAKKVLELGYTKVGLLYETNEYPVGWKDSFKQIFTALGGKVVVEESILSTDIDIKTQLAKLDSTDVNTIVAVVLSEPMSAKIVDSFITLGIQKQLIGNEIFAFTSIVEKSKGLSKPIVVAQYAFDPHSKEFESFLAKYKMKFDKIPNEKIYAALGYDQYSLIYNALLFCGNDSPNCIKDYLSTKRAINGVSGDYYLDSNGDAIREISVGKPIN